MCVYRCIHINHTLLSRDTLTPILRKKCTINKNGSEKEEKIGMMKEDLLHWVGLALGSDNKSYLSIFKYRNKRGINTEVRKMRIKT